MAKLKIFSRAELASVVIIFCLLIIVSVPNFIASFRRARDQNRRDDMGVLEHALGLYYTDLSAFPPSSPDGEIMDCLKPGDKPYQDVKGRWIVNPIVCEWGKDSFVNLITAKNYMLRLPRDPDWQKGASYLYISDGERYQLFAAMEGKDEAEVDPKIIAEHLLCGSEVCNMARSSGCDIPKTLQQCTSEAIKLKK